MVHEGHRVGCGSGGGVVTVKPQHVGDVIIPNTHNQNHAAAAECVAHSSKSALGPESVGVAEERLLVGTEVVGNRVMSCGHWLSH